MMGWVRFENTTPENMKVAPVGDKAFRLWFNASCYSSRNQTDGKVPAAIITHLSMTATKREVAELLEAGLLEKLDARTYVIHDYLDYNPSRERISEMREGNKARVAKWRSERDSNAVTERGSNGVTESDVTALQSHNPRGRDRSVSVNDSEGSSNREGSRTRRAPQKRPDQNVLPVMPDELHHVAHLSLRVLHGVWEQCGGLEPTLRGVGLAVAAFPDRDHVMVARNVEHWLVCGNGREVICGDTVQRFRTFLRSTAPSRPGQPAPENVRAIRKPGTVERRSVRDLHDADPATRERIERRLAQLDESEAAS